MRGNGTVWPFALDIGYPLPCIYKLRALISWLARIVGIGAVVSWGSDGG